MTDYPLPGYHFIAIFELPQFPSDTQFQEVSGLSVSAEFETLAEGGENRFQHQLPTRLAYGDITFKRGKTIGSGLLHWARRGLESFDFKPANVMISLLDETHAPVCNWYVVNAIPKRLDVGGLNAMQSELVIETLVISYHYFTYSDPVALALDAAAGVAGSVSVDVSF